MSAPESLPHEPGLAYGLGETKTVAFEVAEMNGKLAVPLGQKSFLGRGRHSPNEAMTIK